MNVRRLGILSQIERITLEKHVNLCQYLNNESCQNTKSISVLMNDNRCDLKCISLEALEGLLLLII